MKNNITGIAISFIFVMVIIISSTLLGRRGILSKEGTRKFIHIGVSNWWIIAMVFFNNKVYASVVPIIFVITNYLSYRFNIVKAMEREEGAKGLGTVYFPISLLVLVFITFGSHSYAYVGALGVLIMGYGDGFAAIAGKKDTKYKYHIFGNVKTLTGSLIMFIVSFIVGFIILSIYDPYRIIFKSLVLAAFATVVEAISPFGTDNLTVPLLTSFLYQFVFLN